MTQSAVFPVRLETRSNLWPGLARENNLSVGLPCAQIDLNTAQLNSLVGRRNEIAHGKKLVVESLGEYSKYESAVMIVLHELAVAVVDCLDQKTFIRPHPAAAELPEAE